MIRSDAEMDAAQQVVLNLKRVLLEARRIHLPQDYRRMSEPILLELQRREQEILEYLSRTRSESPVA